MVTKTIVVVSNLVDATIKEYQPDVDFKLFKRIEDLDEYLETRPIRADILFFTRDVVEGSAGSAFNYMKDLVTQNAYLSVNRVIYITEEDSKEITTFEYLINEFVLDNWEIIKGTLSRTFIQEVVNGTFRSDTYDAKRKAVIRAPRADYVKEQLKRHDSLQENYVSDEDDLKDIPDEEIPLTPIAPREAILKKVYIAGKKTKERTAFTLLAAQYIARTDKVLLIESDPEYHLVTEFVTKAEIPCSVVTVTEIYDDMQQALDKIRNSANNLVIIEAIDRIPFDYRYLLTLLYYNLIADFDYIINEIELNELPYAEPITVVTPSTITDVLATGELVDKSYIPYIKFVGIDLGDLPETHVSSGMVLGKLFDSLLQENGIECPVLTISSLRLGNTAYDLGSIISGGVNK